MIFASGGTSSGASDRTVLSNSALDTSQLPQLSEHDFQRLEPAFRQSLLAPRIVAAVVLLVATIVLLVVGAWPPAATLAAAVGALVLLATNVAVVLVEAQRIGYHVRERDISLRRGVINQSIASVPFNRVQHVSVERNGWERAFGLASITINTAGGVAGRLRVPGLSPHRATSLKAVILERSGIDDIPPAGQ
jgi:membrane protein YdbS with pleckstrin-like domain